MQWVMALDYEEDTEKVIAATENEVFIIDASVCRPPKARPSSPLMHPLSTTTATDTRTSAEVILC